MLLDDHLVRDVLVGRPLDELGSSADDGFATTGLWMFRLCSALNRRDVAGALSAPVADLEPEAQSRFRRAVTHLPASMVVLSLRDLAWPMADLQARHAAAGRRLSTLSCEALAAAHRLETGIAVSHRDVGPSLEAAARADGIAFHVV